MFNVQNFHNYFELEIKQNDKEYIFNISNSIHENVNTLDFSKTTKKDTQNHGLGIENIKSVVSKYKGEIEWNIQNNLSLCVTIILPRT